jgi:hypothetical protein
MSLGLLTDKNTVEREFQYISLVNCGMRKTVTGIFDFLKHYKHFCFHFAKFDLCDVSFSFSRLLLLPVGIARC